MRIINELAKWDWGMSFIAWYARVLKAITPKKPKQVRRKRTKAPCAICGRIVTQCFNGKPIRHIHAIVEESQTITPEEVNNEAELDRIHAFE